MQAANAIQHRLEILRKLLKDAEKHPKANEKYIEDLKTSIEACENTQPLKPFNSR